MAECRIEADFFAGQGDLTQESWRISSQINAAPAEKDASRRRFAIFQTGPKLFLRRGGDAVSLQLNRAIRYILYARSRAAGTQGESPVKGGFVDYDWYEEIENKIDKGDYVFYAQKRFAQNMGQPNPITTPDEFIKWLITISENEGCISKNDRILIKMVDYLKKALIYGHTSRISS